LSVDENQIRANILKETEERATEIMALAERHGFEKKGIEFISKNKNVEDFRSYILDNLDKSKSTQVRVADNPDLGLSDKDVKNFSVLRAVQAVITGNRELAAFEFDVSDEYRKKNKEKKYEGAFTIPSDVQRASFKHRSFGAQAMQKRDMNVGSGTAGGYLVGTQHDADNFIDLLRSKMMLTQLGARVISGLTGNIAIPKLTGGATGYWVDEGSDVTESNPTVGQVTLSPKTVGAYVDYTRRTVLQSSPDIEAMLEDDLMQVIARQIDQKGLNGTGSNGEPTGILNTSGRGQVDYGAGMTWADVVNAEGEIAADDADIGNLAYLFTVALRSSMKQTLKASGVAGYIWDGGEINGYPAFATNQMPAAKGIFGNFNDLIIGEWSGLDIQVENVTLGKSGGHRIIALQDVDVAIRHPESFCELYT
jgi:HK97 family phage major capsid protein